MSKTIVKSNFIQTSKILQEHLSGFKNSKVENEEIFEKNNLFPERNKNYFTDFFKAEEIVIFFLIRKGNTAENVEEVLREI